MAVTEMRTKRFIYFSYFIQRIGRDFFERRSEEDPFLRFVIVNTSHHIRIIVTVTVNVVIVATTAAAPQLSAFFNRKIGRKKM